MKSVDGFSSHLLHTACENKTECMSGLGVYKTSYEYNESLQTNSQANKG